MPATHVQCCGVWFENAGWAGFVGFLIGFSSFMLGWYLLRLGAHAVARLAVQAWAVLAAALVAVPRTEQF